MRRNKIYVWSLLLIIFFSPLVKAKEQYQHPLVLKYKNGLDQCTSSNKELLEKDFCTAFQKVFFSKEPLLDTQIIPKKMLGVGLYIANDEEPRINNIKQRIKLGLMHMTDDASVAIEHIAPTSNNEQTLIDSVVENLLSVLSEKSKTTLFIPKELDLELEKNKGKFNHYPLAKKEDEQNVFRFINPKERLFSDIKRIKLKNDQTCLVVYQTPKDKDWKFLGVYVWIFPEISLSVKGKEKKK